MRTAWVTAAIAAAAMTWIGCGGRTTNPAAPPAAAPQANTPGAEAAARITPQEYDAFEKMIGEQYPDLQKQLAARDLAKAANAAKELAVSFGDVERFWAQNKRADAVKWAQDARSLATQVAGAAAAGDAAKAGRAAASLEGMCMQCHAAYREADAGGGFRIKPAALTH